MLTLIALPLISNGAQAKETRCGWFDNPTPGNMWLNDKDGEWTIGSQGSYSIEDEWEWPKYADGQWVMVNGNYGYGCACFTVETDEKQMQVTKIYSAKGKPLSACRKDAALKGKEPKSE